MSLIPAHEWGIKSDIVPRLGVRLVQEGNRLHYLADWASITGKFSDAECLKMNSRHAHCVTLYHNGFTCEADTLGSCGYVYIAIYPTQR